MIDVVVINGVSSGLVMHITGTDYIQIVGTVSEYQANGVTGETLQVLLMAQDNFHFHDVPCHVSCIYEGNKKKVETDDLRKIGNLKTVKVS